MSSYDPQYEEYKASLLRDRRLRNELHDKYEGSLRVEKDYIDENGVLWKIGGLGAVCGFCIAFTPIENGNWILGIVLFLAIIGSIIFARHIGAKFKKSLGEMIFYAFRYHKHFEDHILEEKRREMQEFEQDLFKIADYMQWYVDNPISEPSEVMDKFNFVSRRIGEIKKKYDHISRFDGFAGSLKNDYHFNAQIQKDIDKYI